MIRPRRSWILVACLLLTLALAYGDEPVAPTLVPKPAEPPAPRVDLYGDPLPRGAIMRLGSTRFRHAGPVRCLAVSPDGKTLASGGDDKVVRLWDAATGKELHRLEEPHTTSIRALAFAPDGRTLVSCPELSLHRPDLYSSWHVSLWDAAGGKRAREIRLSTADGASLPAAAGTSLAFTPDGKTLLNASCLFDVATGRYLRCCGFRWVYPHGVPPTEGWGTPVYGLSLAVLAPDGRSVFAADLYHSRLVAMYRAGSAEQIWGGEEDGERVVALAYGPDGKVVASGDWDGRIRIREAGTGKVLRQLSGAAPDAPPGAAQHRICCLAYSPDGKTLAAAGSWPAIELWDLTGEGRPRQLLGHAQDFPNHPAVTAITFSPDGKLLYSGGVDGTVRRWDVATAQEVAGPASHQGPVADLAVALNGRLVASGGMDGTVRLWELPGGKEVRRLVGPPGHMSAVAFSPDGQLLASAHQPKTVHLSRTAGGELLRQLAHDDDVYGLAFSPDGRLLASAANHAGVYVWDVASGKRLHRLEVLYPQRAWGVRFSPDGKLLAACVEASLVMWDVATATRIELPVSGKYPPAGYAGAMSFTSDSRRMALGFGTGFYVWDLQAGQPLLELDDSRQQAFGLALSPDETSVALGCKDGTVQLWELATKQLRCSFAAHPGAVNRLAFRPDGTTLLTTGTEGTLIAWDLSQLAVPAAEWKSAVSSADRTRLWEDLASSDAARAYRALWRLATDADASLPLLRNGLRPALAVDKRIQQLVTDLDADDFGTRERASKELAVLIGWAEPTLRRVLANAPSAECRRRVESLLRLVGVPSLERVRVLRAVEVLQNTRSPAALALLETLAREGPDAEIRRTADRALSALRRLVTNN